MNKFIELESSDYGDKILFNISNIIAIMESFNSSQTLIYTNKLNDNEKMEYYKINDTYENVKNKLIELSK